MNTTRGCKPRKNPETLVHKCLSWTVEQRRSMPPICQNYWLNYFDYFNDWKITLKYWITRTKRWNPCLAFLPPRPSFICKWMIKLDSFTAIDYFFIFLLLEEALFPWETRRTPFLNEPISSLSPLSTPPDFFSLFFLLARAFRDTIPAAIDSSKALCSLWADFLAIPRPIFAGILTPFCRFAPSSKSRSCSNFAFAFLSSPVAPAYQPRGRTRQS